MVVSSFSTCIQILFVAISLSAWPQEAAQPQGTSQAHTHNRTAMSESQHQHGRPTGGQSMDQMAGMPKTNQNAFIAAITSHADSGTSAEANSISSPMLMATRGKWMLMFHGEAFLNAVQQSATRGADKFFSTNWFMPMAQRQLGPGTFTGRVMLSLDPATVTKRYYPELFQQGETAFGKPIVDGQHPHDLIMELAAMYDLKLGENALLSFYVAPVGDPAMGPPAYPHRASASEDPIAPLGHHLQDSTHIANDVITAGLTYKVARFEASGLHGREPDEYRWDIDSGKINSLSIRATVNPAQNWSAQYSFAHLTAPEALHPQEDVDRMTSSLMYNRLFVRGNWASLLVWGRNHTSDGLVWNSYLAESTLRFCDRNYLWGRIENVDRTNELLLGGRPEPPNFQESVIGRVQAYTAGYDRDIKVLPYALTALGAQFTIYTAPRPLWAEYGSHPLGAVVFLRV